MLTLTAVIAALSKGETLSSDCMEETMMTILNEQPDPCQIAAILAMLACRLPTVDELIGAVTALRATMLPLAVDIPVIDIVGTGGDNANTFNISTASAILLASCGVAVVKHGNRAVSSRCGSADVLDALGISLTLTPTQLQSCLHAVNIAFCYAPQFHAALKQVKPIRRALGIRTLFNLVGPLLNPARATYLLLGVADADLMPLMAETLLRLGVTRGMVVYGHGLDELSVLGPSDVLELHHDHITPRHIDPVQYGLARAPLSALQGGDAAQNAALLQSIFEGRADQAMIDTVILNTGTALYIREVVPTIEAGIEFARRQLYNGAALHQLHEWRATCQRLHLIHPSR